MASTKGSTKARPANEQVTASTETVGNEPEANTAVEGEPTVGAGAETEATNSERGKALRTFEVVDELPDNPKSEARGFTPQFKGIVEKVVKEGPEGKWIKVTEYSTPTGARNVQKEFEPEAVPTLDENGAEQYDAKGNLKTHSVSYNRKTGESYITDEKLKAMGIEGVVVETAVRRKLNEGKDKGSLLYMKWHKATAAAEG